MAVHPVPSSECAPVRVEKIIHPQIGRTINTIVNQSICLLGLTIRQIRMWITKAVRKRPIPKKTTERLINGVLLFRQPSPAFFGGFIDYAFFVTH